MMTNEDVRRARAYLGLSVRQMAVFLKTDPQSVRRLELNPKYSTSRRPSPRLQLELQEVLDRYE
tara:strand:+ start:488 stop:679 length:192 start_codon:yes stop_codon:yes gene_type:complete